MPLERKIVVLIDDDEEFLSELQEALAFSGFIPVTATNKADAMKAARRLRPDAILLDLKLGKDNGYEVAEKLRKDPATARIPIIMMSGHFNEPAGNRPLKASNINFYLNKPFSQRDVVRSIQAILADKEEAASGVKKQVLYDPTKEPGTPH